MGNNQPTTIVGCAQVPHTTATQALLKGMLHNFFVKPKLWLLSPLYNAL